MPDDVRADAPSETGFGNLDEATLRALIEHVPVTVYIDRLDETGSNVYTSPRLESELGYTAEEWISDRELYAKILHPEDRERILAEYRRTRDTDEQLRRQRQYFESLVKINPTAVVTVDRDGVVTSWNLAAEELFGYSRDEAIGRNLDDLVVGQDLRRQAV